MGGPRFEQLSRATGTVRVGDQEHSLRRRCAAGPPPGQSAGSGRSAVTPGSRPSSRADGPSATSSTRRVTTAWPTYNEGYLFDGDGELIPAWVVEAPWLRRLQPHRGGRLGRARDRDRAPPASQGESLMSNFMVMGGVGVEPGLPRPAAGHRPLHLGRRDRQRHDGALDAGKSDHASRERPAAATVAAASTTSSPRRGRRPGSTTSAATAGGRGSKSSSVRRRPRPASTTSASSRSTRRWSAPSSTGLQVEDWYGRHPEIDEQDGRRRAPGRGLPAHRLDGPVAPARRGRRPSATCASGRRRPRARPRAVPRGGRGPAGSGAGHGRTRSRRAWRRACGRCCRSRRPGPWRTTT